MTCRPATRAAAAVSLVALLAACGGGSATGPNDPPTPTPTPTPTPRPPNIVLILADDLDVASIEHMPVLRTRLQDQGLTFTESFATTPLCGPSRATLLSGQYMHNHGILDNLPPLGGFQKWRATGREASTVATWLKERGYLTALVGKYVNRYPEPGPETYVPPGWDEWHSAFSDRGSDAYYNYFVNDNGRIVHHGRTDADYITDLLGDRAIEVLRRTEARDEQPFFLHLSPNAPHRPAVVARRHAGSFAGMRAPQLPSFNERDMSDKPRWYREQPLLTAVDIGATDRLYRDRLGSLLAVDEMLERLMTELAALGELENTYVFFASDNGFLLGQHRFPHGKDAPYEESIRVPLIVKGPGVPAGRRVSALVANIDLAPTFGDLAAARVPDTVDGRSLVPLLGGDVPAGWRQDLLIEHHRGAESGLPNWAGIRTASTVYVEYPGGERELYDLQADPYQLESQHRSAPGSQLQSLASRLAVLASCRGTSCRQ